MQNLLQLSNKFMNLSAGNPFICEWLVREALTSKNVHLGRKSYIVSSKHDILKVAGIQCFEDNEANVQRLIVVETNHDENENVEVVLSLLSLIPAF